MLIDEFMTKCVIMDRKSVSDGVGGFSHEWVEGAQFMAAVHKDSSMEARIAEKQGVTELYTVTIQKGSRLEYHDVFKRLSDGEVFRVTSNQMDRETPKIASFQFGRVTAERWELT